MNCDAQDCRRPDEQVSENEAHIFRASGYMLCFHPECCPRVSDGIICEKGGHRPSLADGVSFQEDRALGHGCWAVVTSSPQGWPVWWHRAKPFNIESVAKEIVEGQARVFSLSPDLYPLAADVMIELTKRGSLGSGPGDPGVIGINCAGSEDTRHRPLGRIWDGHIIGCHVYTSVELDSDAWVVDGRGRTGLDPRSLGDEIARGARDIAVPESYSPILTALAESQPTTGELLLTAEKLLDLDPQVDAFRRVQEEHGRRFHEIVEQKGRELAPFFEWMSSQMSALPESYEGISVTNAFSLWRALASRGFEADLEHCLRYGKRGEPSFYRVRVRLRHLNSSDIESILALAKEREAKVAWYVKGAGEPVMELI